MRYIYVVGLLGLLLGGCCPKITPQSSDKQDSVRVVREVEYIERVRDSLIYIEVPAEVKEVVTMQDSSHLETSVALSDAWINPDGLLTHTLINKALKLPKEVSIKDSYQFEVRDSVIYKAEYVTKVVRERYVPWYYKGAMWVAVIAVVGWIYRLLRFFKIR